jgi:hypothetical protein
MVDPAAPPEHDFNRDLTFRPLTPERQAQFENELPERFQA